MNRIKIASRRRQQGVTLLIALIMLVAMTMAGIVMFRMIGTGVIIARNLTFRQGALASADRGIEAARAWLITQTAGALEQAIVAQGYFPAWCNISVNASNVPDVDGNGQADNCGNEPAPSTFVPSTYEWANSVQAVADDGAGNEVRYVIHRMCHIPGAATLSGQHCISDFKAGQLSHGPNEPIISSTMRPYYRITVRVTGPMNTVAYTQAVIN